jgi:hypothetical protein
MNARGPRHLRQPAERALHVTGISVHQIGQFINKDGDIGQRLNVRAAVLGRLAVVAENVAGAQVGKGLIAAVHFGRQPAQHAHGPVSFHLHAADQVGQAVKAHQLHLFGVNHDQVQVVRAVVEDQVGNHGVEADRFTGTGGAGNEQMGQPGQIDGHRRAGHVSPQTHGQRALQTANSPIR